MNEPAVIKTRKNRMGDLFRMDMRRMLHGKAFYALLIAAVYLPVMLIQQMGRTEGVMSFIAGSGSFESFGTLLSSMSNVLTGILLCICISREYSSGFIKNIAAAHADRLDYIMSKGLMALISNIIFTAVYYLAVFGVGVVMGMDLSVPSVIGLAWYILEKVILSIPMSMLVIFISLIFRSRSGMGITVNLFVSMGIVVRIAQMALQFMGLGGIAKALNFTITGASAFVTMAPSVLILAVAGIAAVWTVALTLGGSFMMSRRDII